MTQRLDYASASPEAIDAMMQLEKFLARCTGERGTLNKSLLELVKLRVSQLNGCAFCIDMHSKDARAAGETEQRIYGLNAWRDTNYYTDAERAALAWAERNTEYTAQGVSDEIYQQAKDLLGERSLVDLTLAVVTINGWNRFVKSFKPEPGLYEVGGVAT